MPLAPALVRMSTTLRWLELQCLENEDADEFGALDEYGIPQHDVSAMNGGMEADAVCLAELQTLKVGTHHLHADRADCVLPIPSSPFRTRR